MADIFYPVAHRSDELIEAFKTRYEDFDEKLIPRIVHDALGLKVKKVVRSTSWGSAHVIYFLHFEKHRDLVFRANINMDKPEVEMLAEKLITDLVAQHGIPTNKVVMVDISRKKYPFDYQIEEKLGGIDPEDEFNGSQQDYENFTFETGVAIAKMSDITLEGFGRLDEKAVKKGKLKGSKKSLADYIAVCLDEDVHSLAEMKVLSNRQVQEILTFFFERKQLTNISQGNLVHYDLADHNLRYEKGHLVGIFDWETAVVGSPVIDLASCPTWRSHFPKREKLLEGYQSIKPLPENFDEFEKIVLLRTMLWKIRYAIRAGILDDKRKAFFKETLKTCLS